MSKSIELKNKLFSIMPPQLVREITALSQGRALSEIRIRRTGRCSILVAGECLPLAILGEDIIDALFMSVCKGTPYAFRDSIGKGYIPLFGGIRVGVVGRARYEGNRLIGISDVSSLVFRIPAARCDFGEELYSIWTRTRGGMLIFAPPGGGKTTALRYLAKRIASGRRARRVVIVDEREELMTDELFGLEIDVLSGYLRAYGISLATRTMNPELIITDEIAPEDAAEILRSANCGVPLIASAHAASIEELMRREDIAAFAASGVFKSFVAIMREGGSFNCMEVRHVG